MKKVIAILSLMAMSSTVVAYPFIYKCMQPTGKDIRILTITGPDSMTITKGTSITPWKSNIDGGDTLDFQYLSNDVYMKVSKNMMLSGSSTGIFVRDKAIETFECSKAASKISN